MSNFLPSPEHLSPHVEELAQLLLDMESLPDFDTAQEFDERYAVLYDMQQLHQEVESFLIETAGAHGKKPSREIVDAWKEDPAYISLLRDRLSRERKRMRMIEGIEQFAIDQEEAHAQQGVPLRDYQRDSVAKFGEFLLHAPRTTPKGGKSGLIEMPTGTGKTGIFANVVSMLKHAEHADEPVRVLVLVPTQEVLNQTVGRKGERGFGKFAPHLDIGAYYQHEKELDREVVVMTTASFNTLLTKGEMPQFDAVVVDEAHTVIGDVTGTNIESYCEDKIAIGLTATPNYDENRSAYNLFKHEISKMSFRHAVETGKLAPVVGYLHEVEAEYDPYTLPTDLAAREWSKTQLELRARIRESEKIIEDAIARGLGVIVRCPAGNDIDVAHTFAKYLSETKYAPNLYGTGYIPIAAESVGGSYKRDRDRPYTQDEIFDQFNAGDVHVLTYVKAIGMGWDSPQAKVLINLAPTTSEVELRQAIGRVMRLIVDREGNPIVAEVHDFASPQMGRNQYTALDALGTKSGQLLTKDPEAEESEAIIPQPRRHKQEIVPDLIDSRSIVLGQVAVEHAEDVQLPSNLEVSAVINIFQGSELPIDDVSRILGVSVPTVRSMLVQVGSSPSAKVKKEEVEVLLEFYPDLKYVPRLPESGFVRAADAIKRLRFPVRLLSFMQRARREGIMLHRFVDPTDKIDFYLKDEDVEEFLQFIEATRYSGLARYKQSPENK